MTSIYLQVCSIISVDSLVAPICFGLGVGDIGRIEFSDPDIKEQKSIARILKAVDKDLMLLVSLREYWNAQKKGLMQKLLTGKIRVKEARQ